MKRPSGEAIGSFACAAVLILVAVLAYRYNPSGSLIFILGIPVAIASGFFLTLGIYLLQQPNLIVGPADDKYNERSGPFFFVHIYVKNESGQFLGGGTALDCQGVLKLGDRTFTPKWASRPEPLSWHLVPTATAGQLTAIPWIDWWIMEDCKSETIGPGEQKTLDILVKVNEDTNAYIHEPENYRDPYHKRKTEEGGIMPPGRHRLTLTLKHRTGGAGPFTIEVENNDSPVPDSVSIRIVS
ncbi:MAG: hypothetical protein WB778_08460 [Thermoplasmata archaeon]